MDNREAQFVPTLNSVIYGFYALGKDWKFIFGYAQAQKCSGAAADTGWAKLSCKSFRRPLRVSFFTVGGCCILTKKCTNGQSSYKRGDVSPQYS